MEHPGLYIPPVAVGVVLPVLGGLDFPLLPATQPLPQLLDVDDEGQVDSGIEPQQDKGHGSGDGVDQPLQTLAVAGSAIPSSLHVHHAVHCAVGHGRCARGLADEVPLGLIEELAHHGEGVGEDGEGHCP